MDRWGQYFKPAGMGQATGDPNRPAAAAASPAASPAADADDEPAPVAKQETAKPVSEPAANNESASRAQDILAMIRNRQKQ
jgi:hypothetical protein